MGKSDGEGGDTQIQQLLSRAPTKSRLTQKIYENIVKSLLSASGLFSIGVSAIIIFVLFGETIGFFSREEVTLSEFFFGLRWSPLLGNTKYFGIWPLVCGTCLVAAIAMLVAVPLGVVTAIYLSEYAAPTVRAILKPTLEVLAGIPTVVYGFFALTVLTPSLKLVFSDLNIYNALSAGLAVGVLCLPTICSLTEDALRAVPTSLREGAYGLGGTRFEVSVRVVLPAALSGIVSAFLLAFARAVGETMIVALAAGNTPRLTLDPTGEVQTMTGFMVQMALGDVSSFSIEYASMYAVAAMLFLITMTLTIIGQMVRRRFREAYE